MAKDENIIKQEIKNYIVSHDGSYDDWYSGITEDPRDRMFGKHNVNEQTNYWIYRESFNSDMARRIEDYLVNTLGTDGNPGGGSNKSVFVYSYRKNSHTTE